MVVISDSCVCQSANKNFRIVTLETTTKSNLSCGNDNKIAINLEDEDYQALGFCQPPVMDQYYSIGLRLPDSNANNRGICNSSLRYFWRTRESEKVNCVDGSPLQLPKNFPGDRRCNLASVLPGSMSKIYNASWTRCSSVQYSICQLEKNASIFNFCKNVSTTTATTTTATTTTATTTTATTALSNNSTAIIIGSVLGVFVVFFFSLLLHFFRKKNNAKRKASDNQIYDEVSEE